MDYRNLVEELEHNEALDAVAEPVAQVVDAVFPPDGALRDALLGKWLGHPLHPVLTDLPIGFWTSAFVFDLLPFRGSGKAARTMVGLGVLTALPTLASGWAEFSMLPKGKRRTAIVHGAAMEVATSLYAFSYLARRRGRTLRGVALAMLGASAATAGGFLGGELVYRLGAGVESTPADQFPSPVLDGGVTSEPLAASPAQ